MINSAKQGVRGMGTSSKMVYYVTATLLFITVASLAGYGIFNQYHYEEDYTYTGYAFDVLTGRLDPGWYIYPNGSIYLYAIALLSYFTYGYGVGMFSGTEAFALQFLVDRNQFFQILLAVNALMTGATAVVMHAVMRRFTPLWLAAAIPLLYITNAFVLNFLLLLWPEGTLSFFIVLPMYFTLLYLEKGEVKYLIAAAFTAGLAAAFKYHSVIAVGLPVAAVFLAARANNFCVKTVLLRLLVVAVLFAVGFFLASPFVVLNAEKVYTMLFGAHSLNAINSIVLQYEYKAGNPVRWFMNMLVEGGWSLVVIYIATVAALIIRPSRELFLLTLPVILLYALITLHRFGLYYHVFPAMPFLYMAGGYAIYSLACTRARGKVLIASGLLLLIFMIQVPSLMNSLQERSRKDSLLAAREWILRNIPRNTHLVVDKMYVPRLPIAKSQLKEQLDAARQQAPGSGRRLELEIRMRTDDGFVLHRLPFGTGFMDAEKQRVRSELLVPMDEFKRQGYSYVVVSSVAWGRYSMFPEYKSVQTYYEGIFSCGEVVYDTERDESPDKVKRQPRITVIRL